MTAKGNLYYLIENYHKGNYDAKSFSEQFLIIFSEGVDGYTGKKEKKAIQRYCWTLYQRHLTIPYLNCKENSNGNGYLQFWQF